MDLASAEAEIRHVFGDTPITEPSIGAAPPGNNIAQCASPVGISAILSQKSKNSDMNSQQIIAYASRALSDTEKRYSQTEKEALAIIWAVEHFHLFIYGSEFTLVTDHKPLEIIYGQRTAKTSARIERWVLRLKLYAFKIVYKSCTNNPADYLFRHPTYESKRKQEKMTEQYINFVTQNSIPKAMSLKRNYPSYKCRCCVNRA